jgi:hypothetical protein
MRLSFGDLLDGETPLFVEDLREIYGVHTCDMRRSKVSPGVSGKVCGVFAEWDSWIWPQTYLAERFPNYKFEPGFSEEDPWWHPGED